MEPTNYGSDKEELEAAQNYDMKDTEIYVHTFLSPENAALVMKTTIPHDTAAAYCIRTGRHPKKLNVIVDQDGDKLTFSVTENKVPERKGWITVQVSEG